MKDYNNLTIIYEGNKTIVYRAKNSKNESFIIKTLPPEKLNKKNYSDLHKEFQILKMVIHPNVIKAIELIEENRKIYLVEEDVSGFSLAELMEGGRGFSIKEFLDIALAIVSGIEAIHSNGIIHKDIKPDNIIYNREKKIVKIIDFDSASLFSRETPEYSPNILEGTLHYISPEQTGRTGRKIDYRTDYYSLGVLFYQMTTGKLPFRAESSIQLIHQHIAGNPEPLYIHDKKIPETVSEIILKLLAKLPENRYQTIDGLAFDLEKARLMLREKKPIAFPVGLNDFSTKLLFPEKLYGRDMESRRIQDIFESFFSRKNSVFNIMIRGETGMGKLTLAQEVYSHLLKKNGYSLYIKFNVNIEKNLQSMIHHFLNQFLLEIFKEKNDFIETWKIKHKNYIEKNLHIILKLFPDSKKLFQDMKHIENHEYNDQNMIDFLNFLNKLDRPVLIIFEDSQWMPEDFSKILEGWFDLEKNSNLFIIYTAQNIQESESHFQNVLIKKLREKKFMEEIYLGPLTVPTIKNILSDILQCSPNESQPLSETLYDKTNGNPFFLFEFLNNLYKKSLLHPPTKKNRPWTWNLESIQKESVTENVANILFEKIQNVDANVYDVLLYSACHGDETPLVLLSHIFNQTELEIATLLNPVISENMISINQNNIRFVHSKFRSLIYNSIEGNEKILMHNKIAKAIQKANQYSNEDSLIDFIYHQNIAKDLLNEEDKIDLLEKNIVIAKQYVELMNFEKAVEYYSDSINLINIIPRKLLFQKIKTLKDIFEEAIKAEFEVRNFAQAEFFLNQAKNFLSEEVCNDFQIFEILILIGHSKFKDATYCALEILKEQEISIKNDPKKNDEFNELIKIKNSEINFDIEPEKNLFANAKTIRKHELIFLAITASWSWNIILFNYLSMKLVLSSLAEGFSYLTPFAFLVYAMILNSSLEDQELSEKVSNYSEELKNYFDNKGSNLAFTFTYYSFIKPWNTHFKELQDVLSTSNNKINLWMQFRYNSLNILSHSLFLFLSRENVSNIEFFLEKKEEFILSNNQKDCEQVWNDFKIFLKILSTNANTIVNSEFLQSFIHTDQSIYQENIHFKLIISVFKIIVCYLSENFLEGYRLGRLCDDFLKGASSHVFLAEFFFFDSLICLSLFRDANEEYKDIYKNHIIKNREKLKQLSFLCEENFASKFFLVEAEMARIANDKLSAIDFYTKAIEYAKKNEFLLEEAISNELVGKFWYENKQTKYEELHIVQAIQIFAVYGSYIKVEILKQKYPKFYMKNIERNTRYLSSRTSSHLHLDTLNPISVEINSIIKEAYSISSENSFYTLLNKINRIIVENSGAERGIILLKQNKTNLYLVENEYSIHSEPKTNINSIYDNYPHISKTIVGLCERTGQIIVTKEAYKDKRFQGEPYIAKNSIKSILCIPIVYNGALEGLVYLENNQIIDAFPIERVENINTIISQITVSIGNAKNYISVKEEVNRFKKLVPWECMNFLIEKAHSDIEVGNYLINELTVCIFGIESFENLQQEISPGQTLSLINHLFVMLSTEIKNIGFIEKIIRDRILIVLDCSIEEAYKRIKDLKNNQLESLIKYNLTTAISRSASTIGVIGHQDSYRTTFFSKSEEIVIALEEVSRRYKTSTLILEEEFQNIQYNGFSYRSLGPILLNSNVFWVIELLDYDKKMEMEKNSLFGKAIRKFWRGNLPESESLLNEYIEKYGNDLVIKSFLLKIEYHKSNLTKPKFLNI